LSANAVPLVSAGATVLDYHLFFDAVIAPDRRNPSDAAHRSPPALKPKPTRFMTFLAESGEQFVPIDPGQFTLDE
jgi:hypothetical protein